MKQRLLNMAFLLLSLPIIVGTGGWSSQCLAQSDVVFFDGMQVPPSTFGTLGMWFGEWWWWKDGLDLEMGGGATPGTNAIIWDQTNGESNIIWGFANPVNLQQAAQDDTLKFKIKAPARTDTLIIEFSSKVNNVDGKVNFYLPGSAGGFDSTAWKLVKIPLKSFFKVTPDTIDWTQVSGFSIYTLRGKGGIHILLSEIWVGNPDVHLPLVFFSGQVVPAGQFSITGWWTSWEWQDLSAVIESGIGPRPGTHAIRWVQRDLWSGVLWVFQQKQDFRARFKSDTLKFKVLAPKRTSQILIEINNDKERAVGYTLAPTAGKFDSTWQQVSIPLKNFTVPFGKNPIDSTQINEVGIFTDTGLDGIIVYLSDIWIGSPVMVEPDLEAPAAPQNITATFVDDGKYYANMVKWDDVPGEEGEVYNVYASQKPITDVNAPEVDLIGSNLAEGTSATGMPHYIFYPLKDGAIPYYYAVTCKDAAGNIGAAGVSEAISNNGKGIPTISLDPPALFAADGDLSEWGGVQPLILSPSKTNAVAGSIFDDDNDLSATVYIAADAGFLYFAAEVTDNAFVTDTVGGNWYGKWDTQDAIVLYIGLYDLKTKKHTNANTATLREAEPDYAFSLLKDKMWVRTMDGDWDFTQLQKHGNGEYYFGKKDDNHWVVEALISFDDIRFNKGGVLDGRFAPERGMTIPLDINFYDSDTPGLVDGMLSFSPLFTGGWDASWFSPSMWANTWIGDITIGVDEKPVQTVTQYSLEQNYPNPFNPTTQIRYSLEAPGMVNLKVFDVLGREVATLVHKYQDAGQHVVDFNAAKIGNELSSGLYIYRLQAGSFVLEKKMLLIR